VSKPQPTNNKPQQLATNRNTTTNYCKPQQTTTTPTNSTTPQQASEEIPSVPIRTRARARQSKRNLLLAETHPHNKPQQTTTNNNPQQTVTPQQTTANHNKPQQRQQTAPHHNNPQHTATRRNTPLKANHNKTRQPQQTTTNKDNPQQTITKPQQASEETPSVPIRTARARARQSNTKLLLAETAPHNKPQQATTNNDKQQRQTTTNHNKTQQAAHPNRQRTRTARVPGGFTPHNKFKPAALLAWRTTRPFKMKHRTPMAPFLIGRQFGRPVIGCKCIAVIGSQPISDDAGNAWTRTARRGTRDHRTCAETGLASTCLGTPDPGREIAH